MTTIMRRNLLALFFLITILTPVIATSLLNGAIEFEVPSKLEIQSGSYLEWSNSVFDVAGLSPEDGSIRIVLQQKGLNEYKQEAFDKYCRIIIEVMCDEEAVDNESYRNFINSLSYLDIREMDSEVKNITQMQDVVDTWYPMEFPDFAGYFATKIAYVRQSQIGKANVYVEKYSIIAGNVVFNITFSYRVTEKSYFLPAIQEFIKSLKLDLSKIPANPTKRSASGSITIPGTTTTIKWPENGKLEFIGSDSNGKYYQCLYVGDCIMGELTVLRMNTKLSEYNQMNEMSVAGAGISTSVKNILNEMGIYSYEITKKLTTSTKIQVEFKFKYEGVDSHGVLLMFFADGYTFVNYLDLELGVDSSIMKDVLDSMLLMIK